MSSEAEHAPWTSAKVKNKYTCMMDTETTFTLFPLHNLIKLPRFITHNTQTFWYNSDPRDSIT